jgi:3-dehydroquinate synthase
LLESLGLPVAPAKLDPDQMMQAMTHDKKVEHGRLRLVLPSRLGHVELVEGVAAADIRAALAGR